MHPEVVSLTDLSYILYMEGFTESILQHTAWQTEAPAMFGGLHLIMLLIIPALAASGARAAKRLDEAARIRLLSCCGWILAVMEVYKQLFIFRIVSGGIYDWWFFPFQLCSVPMYMCILLPFTSERSSLRAAMLTFMTGYTFISAAAALIYPEDYLRSYVTLTAHGFVWHGILLFISLTIGLSCMSDLSRRGILRSVSLYLLLSAAAIGINMYADRAMRSAHASGYAAMFYLNPYHISPQPVVGAIQESAGIPAGLALYMMAVTAAGILADLGFRRYAQMSGKKHS